MTCNICCENFNKSNHSRVICCYDSCQFQSCKQCVRTYILGSISEPHCMSCKNPFSQEFLVNNLNKSFMENDYKNHRKTLLTDKAIARSQELMPLVEKTIQIDTRVNMLNTLTKQRAELNKQVRELSILINKTTREIHNIKNGDSEQERKQFIMPCPADNCKGYLSQKYRCTVCELYTCHECFEIIGYKNNDPHTCNEDCLKNAEAIKRETKPCPQCGIRIYKIAGCDQMWCTECQVTFSWNTGKIIITQTIHNPHYYEYMRKNQSNRDILRNPGDVLCGGIIIYYQLSAITRCITEHRNLIKDSKYISDYNNEIVINRILTDIHREMNHFNNIDLVSMRTRVTRLDNNDEDTVKYIRNLINREELSKIIIKSDIMKRKSHKVLQIYELISIVSIEGFNSIYTKYRTLYSMLVANKNKRDSKSDDLFIDMYNEIVKFIEQFNYIINYSNYELAQVSYNYNISALNYTINYSLNDLTKYDIKKPMYFSITKKFTKPEIETLKKYSENFSTNINTSGAGPSTNV